MPERSAESRKVGILGQIALGVPVTVALEALRPEQLLRLLDDLRAPIRLSATGPRGSAELDLGNGLLMGVSAARRATPDAPVVGLEALRFFLAMERGHARIAPCRFLELANLVRTVEQALAAASSTGAPPSEEARVSPPLTPLYAPGDTDREPEPAVADPVEPVRVVPRRRSGGGSTEITPLRAARRRWTAWALAAACLIALLVGSIAGFLIPPAPPAGGGATGAKKMDAAKAVVLVVDPASVPRGTGDAHAPGDGRFRGGGAGQTSPQI